MKWTKKAVGTGKANFPVQYDLSGRVEVIVKGSKTQVIGDCAFFLLRTSWTKFLCCLVMAYLILILGFAGIYLAEADGMICLIKDEPCDFWDALNLSVHSMSTIGFGSIVPQSALAHSAVAVEFWIAVLMGAGAGGLLFSRVSTASSRVAFSDVALVTNIRGCPTVTMRIVNERPFSSLFDVTCRVSALVKDPKAGMRILVPCELERSTNMMFRAVWNILHRLDEKSPLYGLDEHNFEDKFLAFVVQIEGTDQTYMQKVFANKCYYPSDFRFNESFEDIMTMGTNTITVDLKGLSTTRHVAERSKRLSFLRANTFTPDEAKKMAAFQTDQDKQDEDVDASASTRPSDGFLPSEELECVDAEKEIFTAAC
ncbi:unnamed protein product [Symbiodinium sp. CCMP2592]|nr:unnamed protein product [Symbiodinium sp. CCMP2592]